MEPTVTWDELDAETKADMSSYATAAMQAMLTGSTKPIDKIDPVMAEKAWDMAEAMVNRRAARSYRLRD